VDLPIENGWIFHSYVLVYQRVNSLAVTWTGIFWGVSHMELMLDGAMKQMV
jgi:hypothetical protein